MRYIFFFILPFTALAVHDHYQPTVSPIMIIQHNYTAHMLTPEWAKEQEEKEKERQIQKKEHLDNKKPIIEKESSDSKKQNYITNSISNLPLNVPPKNNIRRPFPSLVVIKR